MCNCQNNCINKYCLNAMNPLDNHLSVSIFMKPTSGVFPLQQRGHFDLHKPPYINTGWWVWVTGHMTLNSKRDIESKQKLNQS